MTVDDRLPHTILGVGPDSHMPRVRPANRVSPLDAYASM